MNIKKLIASAVTALAVMATAACFAQIPETELNIGGIEPGQDIGYTEQIYGKPGKFEDEAFIRVYIYNDKFIVSYILLKSNNYIEIC